MRIREATADDAPDIASVHVRSWQVAYRGLLPDEVLDGLSAQGRTELWSRILETDRPGDAVLVVDGEAGTEGFAHVCTSRDGDRGEHTGEISSLYLVPEAWGSGRGRALMEAAEARLAAEGYREATLWVLVANARARRFYAAAGWECDGTQRTEAIAGGRALVTETHYRRVLRTRT